MFCDISERLKAAFDKKPYDIEHRLLVDGKVKWVREKAELHFNEKDECIRGTGFTQDITVRKRAEEALRESEEKYRSMMESMKDPLYICSPDFRVEYMNPAMIRRTGRNATGEFCFKVLHNLEEKCPWCMHDKALQGESFESEIVSPKDSLCLMVLVTDHTWVQALIQHKNDSARITRTANST